MSTWMTVESKPPCLYVTSTFEAAASKKTPKGLPCTDSTAFIRDLPVIPVATIAVFRGQKACLHQQASPKLLMAATRGRCQCLPAPRVHTDKPCIYCANALTSDLARRIPRWPPWSQIPIFMDAAEASALIYNGCVDRPAALRIVCSALNGMSSWASNRTFAGTHLMRLC